MRNNSLFANLEILDKRFPSLAQKILQVNSVDIEVTNAQDNGHCYAIRTETGQWAPITNPINPIEKATEAIKSMEARLLNGMSPAVIVGLAPGYELEIVHNHFKSQNETHGYPFRRIYVLIQSAAALVAWLKAQDRSEILNNKQVEFYWHDETPKIIEQCESDWRRSHHFIPMTSLDDDTATHILKSLEQFYIKRKNEADVLLSNLEEYYSNISDEVLDTIIDQKAARKPRLMMPTHSSSTVVQYSTRDTLDLFENEGWEVMEMKADTEITHWSMIKQLHNFKPDIVISINHLRTEEKEQCYPDNLMFITWIQDTISTINNSDIAKEWNKMVNSKSLKRDKIIGYVKQIRQYGYQEDRLNECPMVVNPKIFKKYELNEEEIKKYSCDICFASNASKTTEQVIEDDLLPSLKKYGVDKTLLEEVSQSLWQHYRSDKTCINYQELEELLRLSPQFNQIYCVLKASEKDIIIQKIFWRLNDVIYRHIVLEWIDDIGDIKLNLYGKGWEKHPRFYKYAKGVVEHGPELSKAYQAAKYCLHLNSTEGGHQRIMEIFLSSNLFLLRKKCLFPHKPQALNKSHLHKVHSYFISNRQSNLPTYSELCSYSDLVFALSKQVEHYDDVPSKENTFDMCKRVSLILSSNLFWNHQNWNNASFNQKEDFIEKITEAKSDETFNWPEIHRQNKLIHTFFFKSIFTKRLPSYELSNEHEKFIHTILKFQKSLNTDVSKAYIFECFNQIEHPGINVTSNLVKRVKKFNKQEIEKIINSLKSINYNDISIDQKMLYDELSKKVNKLLS